MGSWNNIPAALLLVVVSCATLTPKLLAEESRLGFQAADSLNCSPDTQMDAEECLQGLRWPAGKFEIQVTVQDDAAVHALVSFSSARPVGIPEVDTVYCQWYAAEDEQGRPMGAPAYIVVHESGSDMRVGKLIASSLPALGVHAFLIELPGYGHRRSERLDRDNLPAIFRQAVADVRRARDAIAVLPDVEAVGLQGTSLGGFVASLAGSLDGRFDCIVLLLCGGDLFDILSTGKKDAAKIMERLRGAGLSDAQVKEQLRAIEPLRIAHRLPADRTWLFAATYDTVVPLRNARLLANQIGLADGHFIELPCNHYSGIIYLPGVLSKMARWIRSAQTSAP